MGSAESHDGPSDGLGTIGTLALAVAVVTVLLTLRPLAGGSDHAAAAGRAGGLLNRGSDSFMIDDERYTYPRPRPSADAPLGRAPDVPDHPSHRFLLVRDGDPVTWDPCRPISMVVDDRRAPPGAAALLREAMDEISAATGLVLEVEGPTSEAPVDARAPVLDRYGDRWAPVLVSWTDPADFPPLAGGVAATAVPQEIGRRDSPNTFVTGRMHLDAPQLTRMLSEPDGRAAVRAVIVHELGHLVGLDHVDDPTQLMHVVSPVFDLGPGDRAGLARLGAGPCVPAL